MNETPLLDQIRVYSEALVEDLPNPTTNIVKAPAPVTPGPAQRSHGWLVAVAAAVLILVLVGGVAWLSRGGVPPADEPTTTIPTETTVPTDTSVPTDSSVPPTEPTTTTTIEAKEAVPPPGEGPKLSFVQSEVLTDDRWNSGVWFKGDLYVLVSGEGGDGARELVRTRDGFAWEVIPGPFGATDARREAPTAAPTSMLQTDGNLLVNVVLPRDGDRGIGSDAFIQVNTSTNGTDWTSSRIELPVPSGSNLAGEFQLGEGFWYSDNFAVGPKGIVVTATIGLVFEGEGFANSLVDPDEGIHVEVVDLDLDRGVMVVAFLDENNDMEQIGDLREVDLNETGFSNSFSNLLDALAADPDWEPLLPGFIAELTTEGGTGFAGVSVGYAWFSSDGDTWKRVDSTGPLAGGEFAGIVATPDGFVATASSVVWQSADGMTWTEATGLASGHGFGWSRLVEWQGELVEHTGVDWIDSLDEDTEVWTLGSPQRQVFADVPTRGLVLDISDFGLIGTPTNAGSWGGGPSATEILFSVDGATWNRWEPTEFSIGDSDGGYAGVAWVVGAGDDFVVVQHRGWDESSESDSYSLWVGVVP